ncbi:MAG: hypothetical protein NTW86_14555 [Candidatus Sumerlaeota bacterium]|nr:hypothetical protein [Candidatus Sumerlaeota bacterium]
MKRILGLLAAFGCAAVSIVAAAQKPEAAPAGSQAQAADEPVEPTASVELFNGKDLAGWTLFVDDASADPVLDMAQWMNVVGEGIHATRPWRVYGELEPGQEMVFKERDSKGLVYNDPERVPTGHLQLHAGDIRYTRSKDQSVIYAARLSAPKARFALSAFGKKGVGKDVVVKSVRLLGCDEPVGWARSDEGIAIDPPSRAVFANEDWPLMYELKAQ